MSFSAIPATRVWWTICFLLCAASNTWSQEHDVTSPNVVDGGGSEIELSRFKRQALQSVSVGGGGLWDLGDRDSTTQRLSSQHLDLGIGSGIPLGSFENILGVTPRFRVDWIDASESLDVPERLYEFELQFFYRTTLRERLSLLGIVSPAIRSDLTTSDRAFRVFALGLLNWECLNDSLTLSFGAVVLGRADLPVLPAVGITWKPSPQAKLDLRFPLASLSYRIKKNGGESEVWSYLSGELGGNTWAVTRATHQSDELSLRDYRLVLGLRRLVDGGGGCFVETGFAVGRRIEFERDDVEIRLSDAAVFQVGWRY